MSFQTISWWILFCRQIFYSPLHFGKTILLFFSRRGRVKRMRKERAEDWDDSLALLSIRLLPSFTTDTNPACLHLPPSHFFLNYWHLRCPIGCPKKAWWFFRFSNYGHFLANFGTFWCSGHFVTFMGTLGTFRHFWALLGTLGTFGHSGHSGHSGHF